MSAKRKGIRLARSRREVNEENLGSVARKPIIPALHVSGIALMMLFPGMIVAFFVEWGYSDAHSDNEWALLISALIVLLVGAALWFGTSTGDKIRPQQVFMAVTLTWILSAAGGALPYLLGDMFAWSEWDKALFESASGFSCTGSTALSDIEANGKGILFWRQITQWYGGMGMVVLALTVLPFLGVGGLSLLAAEAPGEGADRLASRMSETAKRLWAIYAGFTLVIAFALWATPQVGLYDAIAHSLSTAATGGFSPRASSIGTYDSVLVETVLIVAMIIGGMSFSLHYRALTGDPKAYWRASDHRLYLMIFVVFTALVTLINWTQGTGSLQDFGTSLRHSTFNVASLLSSTGFGSATAANAPGDFITWPTGAVIVLLLLYVIGGNAGSTAGGIKVFRFQVAMSHMIRQIQRTRHSRGVIHVKVGREVIPEPVVHRVMSFLSMFFMLAIAATLGLAAMGIPLMESGAAVVNAMSNMGPGLGDAGPTGSFGIDQYPPAARLVLAAMMMVGRLELTAVVMVVSGVVSSVRRVRIRLSRPPASDKGARLLKH